MTTNREYFDISPNSLNKCVKISLENLCVIFSLNFSSAGKGPFMADKAKNMPQRCTFLEGGEGVMERVTWPYLRRS